MATLQNLNFVPTSIAGCQLWLDAADNSTLTITAGSVTQWNDKSGNGRNTSAVYGTPQLRTTGFGGRQALYFSSGSGFTGPITNTGTTVTAFAVARYNTSGVGLRVLSLGQAGRFDFGTSTDIVALTTGNATTELGWYRNVGATGSAFVTTIYNAGFLYNLVVNGSTGVIWLNSTSTSSGVTSGSFGYSTYGIGVGFSTGGVVPSLNDGFIAEVLVYNASFSDVQRQQIEGYLAWKWGLVGNLPATHPFKLIAPNSANLAYPSALTVPVPTQSFSLSSFPLVFLSPNSIPGLVLWLDAADTSTLSLSGTTVTQWRDKSSSRLAGSSSAGRNFTYATNILNGLNVVQTATGQTLQVPTLALGAQMSIFLLYYPINQSTSSPFIELGPDANATPGFYFHAGGGANYNILNGGTVSQANFGNVTSQNAWQILEGINKDPNASNTMGFYTNGNLRASGGNTTTNVGTTNTLFINGRNNGNTISVASYIAEIIIYNTALTNSQRQQIEGYLAWKWGLRALLPSSNPYVNIVPAPNGLPILFYGFQPASFRPTQISGCQIWLDAADANSLILSGSNVTQWNDKSGNGYNATGVSNPTYSSSSRAVNFNSNYFTTTYTTGGSNQTSFFVFYPTNAGGQNRTVLGGNNAFNQGIVLFQWNSFPGNTNIGVVVHNVGYGSITSNGSFPINTTQIGELVISNSNSQVYINGAANGATNVALSGFSNSTVWIGGYGNNGVFSNTNSFIGLMNEAIIYNTPLSTTQRQTIEGYLAWKWGLQGSLPAGHPFAKWPPPPL